MCKQNLCERCKERPTLGPSHPLCYSCNEEQKELSLGQVHGPSGGSMAPGGRMLPQGKCGHCFVGPTCPICGSSFF